MKSVRLQRRGAWLVSEAGEGEKSSWQMASVQGPLAFESQDREYFRVETTNQEILLVSRHFGEKGMRELRLDSVIVTPSQNQQERASVA